MRPGDGESRVRMGFTPDHLDPEDAIDVGLACRASDCPHGIDVADPVGLSQDDEDLLAGPVVIDAVKHVSPVIKDDAAIDGDHISTEGSRNNGGGKSGASDGTINSTHSNG